LAVSKRLRAEILRRDSSTCQKCGAKAPDVPLVIDHVIPVALGGSDEPSNLQVLCEPCNSGKSATPPDAAMVEQVSSDARRWAAAMQAAAANMLGDLKSRQKNRDYFRQCWLKWHWGTAESPEYAPLPAAWEKSIDQILAGGLPVELLKDCIDTAFAYENVKRENKFKYACGVAWRKIDKLQQDARAALGDGAPPATAGDHQSWRPKLVDDLIEVFNEGDIEEARDVGIDLDAVRQGVPRDEEDGRDPVVALVESVYWDYRMEADFTHDDVMDLLLELPAGVGEHAFKIARFYLYDDGETPAAGRARFFRQAMRTARELFRVRESLEYLDGLPGAERTAWMAYGCALAGVDRRPGGRRDRTHELEKAAEAARAIKGGAYYPAMCQWPDDVLPSCCRQAHFFVLFEGVKCCAEVASDERHALHGFCEAHLEALVENGFTAPNGQLFAIRDFWELEESAEEEPPF
jgi:hypothetical protein